MSRLDLIDAPSPVFNERALPIDMIVLHYTGMRTGAAALAKLRDAAPRRGDYAADMPAEWAEGDPNDALGAASAHYLVEEDGRIFAVVPEDKRAWHAGKSWWAGQSDVNSLSIGVEIVNGGHDFGLPDYPPAQIASVIALVKDIAARHAIAPWRIVGHSDIAPGRKLDPGEHFPWTQLEAEGAALGRAGARANDAETARVLHAPGDGGADVQRLQERLEAWGYGLAASGGYDERTQACVEAFQRRWSAGDDSEFRFGVWTGRDEALLSAAFENAQAAARAAQEAGAPYACEPPKDPG